MSGAGFNDWLPDNAAEFWLFSASLAVALVFSLIALGQSRWRR